jgi:hypothetical protein
MNGLYNHTLHHLDQAFRKLERMVPLPQKVQYPDGFNYRYREQTIHQALVQKLARVVSGLHAARLLHEHGFVQEQASMQRVLDELHEDILFLAFAVIKKNLTPAHQEYLAEFYKEEKNRMVPAGRFVSTLPRSIQLAIMKTPRNSIACCMASTLAMYTELPRISWNCVKELRHSSKSMA